MSVTQFKRGFGFGCRETPDIYNKFLEQHGFFRKHIATDSSSLFRVVSELQFDIQLHHGKVRLECVKFMRSNRGIFSKEIKYAYESYVNNIARTRTYGGLLELKALALRYKANVFLFEPLTEGYWFLYNPKYNTTWRIYKGRDNHFDVVYPMEYIEVAAECQAIVYELLYTRVLGLPDVEYAVERMLHDPDDTLMTYKTDADGTTTATTADGLQMKLCKPGNTQCVLMYAHLCHFHNQQDFDVIEDFFLKYGSDEGWRVYIGDYFQERASKPYPLLTDPNRSCVRQLLALGITPFPYKVAKSLDPCIYRNVEYDVWHEMRGERMNELLENEKRIQNEKYVNGRKLLNPLAVMKNASREQGCAQLYANCVPQQTIQGAFATVEVVNHLDIYARPDSLYSNAYPLQSLYFPPHEPYINPPELSQVACTENGPHIIGTPGYFYNSFPSTPPPLQFAAHVTGATSPLRHFQPTPTLPTNESLTVFQPTQNPPMSLEYVMVVDSTPQTQQQQQQYYYQDPQQLQQHNYSPQQNRSYQQRGNNQQQRHLWHRHQQHQQQQK